MISKSELNRLKQEPPQELIDIDTIHIDSLLTEKERLLSFLNQIKNPYYFKSSGISVSINFEGKEDLRNIIFDYLKEKK